MNNSRSTQKTSGLRICIASSGLGHTTRGVESWAEDMGRALAQRGEKVILCKGAGPIAAEYERVIPCWTRYSRSNERCLHWLPHALAWRLGVGSAYEVEQTTFAWNLLHLLRREPVDILHVQDPRLALFMQRAGRMKLISAKTVFGHVTEEPIALLKKFQFLQHVAPWHRTEAARRGVDHPDWTMIPNFIDTSQFQPGDSRELRRELSIPFDASVLLVASAIKKTHKRVDYLIDEVAEVIKRCPDLPLMIVIAGGRENDTDELVRKGQDLLRDRIRFLIQFPRQRMPELYRMADLLIHGSLFEMFGTVLLEAMATGVPCIVHNHPVMSWVVAQGGRATDLSLPGNLTSLLLALLPDPAAIQQLGVVSRQRVCHEFSRDVVVERMLEYYLRIATPH